MADKMPEQEWTLPVVDSDIPVRTEQAGISSTGAWASYAIGVVTKKLQNEQTSGAFSLGKKEIDQALSDSNNGNSTKDD